MKVLIVTKDVYFSRMLTLELAAFGVTVNEADEFSAETLALAESADFTVLDAEVFAAEPQEIAELERTQVVLFGYAPDLSAVEHKTASGFRVFMRPFPVSEFISFIFERGAEAEFGTRLAKRRKSAADSLILNEKSLTVTFHRQTVELTNREFALLMLLIRNKGQTVSRADAAKAVWGKETQSDTNIVDVYIRYLREKLDEKFGMKIISTVRGVGYTIKTE